ncbi:hypothetical protein QBC35DRAFT_485974 [Podospora australis]|uniref:Mitochondrial distribution and morphology protein 12 n=1 Tax=Podospora australis TaxID=1536484 RepID=A0AAN7AK89_9PEZI|nr:hypothetical protein QBC35DRAFT_485974 [Podospora australis]
MSIDLNWDTVTGGPDGQELAEQIRDFIHTKFQAVPLPRFIKSVTVHDFQFGNIPPEIELKDITDPLPDFYEETLDSDASEDGSDEDEEEANAAAQVLEDRRRRGGGQTEPPGSGGPRNNGAGAHFPQHLGLGSPGRMSRNGADMSSPFLRVSTPGIPGGTSNLHYFHSQFATGLSGTQTPLAAVAGAQHLNNAWLDVHGHGHSNSAPNLHQYGGIDGQSPSPGPGSNHSGSGIHHTLRAPYQPSHHRNPSQSSIDFNQAVPGVSPSFPPPGGLTLPHHPSLREKHSVSTLAPTTTSANGPSRPPTRDREKASSGLAMSGSAVDDPDDLDSPGARPNPSSSKKPATPEAEDDDGEEEQEKRRLRERRLDDLQAVFRIRYAGDIKLLLTADILLDYPMPSFVGIPVRLSITGLTFDGVGVCAKIRKRVHFCFLSPEDAVAAVGAEESQDMPSPPAAESSSQPARPLQQSSPRPPQQRRTTLTGQGQTGPGSGNTSTTKLGGLLQEIKVESEIGQRESGKQSLKNVGKVERFVLEQVRRIFEEEFVYPSFWTFLV